MELRAAPVPIIRAKRITLRNSGALGSRGTMTIRAENRGPEFVAGCSLYPPGLKEDLNAVFKPLNC